MGLYEVMVAVCEAARPFRDGTAITPENRDQAVKELEEFTFAVKMAKRLDTTGYDLTEAMAGRVSTYLRER